MKAETYAHSVLENKIPAPKYVKLQCKEFLDILDSSNKAEKAEKSGKAGKARKAGKEKDNKDRSESSEYFVDLKRLAMIEQTLKTMIMPRGLRAGDTIYDCSCGYQWLFYTSILCVVHRENPQKRRYEMAILEIGRKNFKTFTIATIFILLFLLEPKFSKFYSVAPDGSRSRLVKEAVTEILKSSPAIYMRDGKIRFKILRDYIQFNLNENTYYPLNYSNSSMDGRMPNVFLADEVGDLPNNYAVESMRSGQINILNKLGCVISTKYPTIQNPLEEMVSYSKQVLDGIQEDQTWFSLLFEPDKTENWMNDDLILKHANPVAIEIPEIWEDLVKKKAYAIVQESARENFLTKHCNIVYQGAGTESFIDIKDLQKCRINKIDWHGREVVYLGVDLSITTDNTAIAMVSVDEDNRILADAWCFIPERRIEEKNRCEKLDYRRFIEHKKCFACGNKTIDYGFVEDFVFDLERKLKCTIRAIGFDRYNAMSSAQKWNKIYKTVEIRQHSDTLHAPTKLLTEKIINGEFEYEKNTLLEINFENAKCVYDTNMNRYVNKRKSSGRVDMVSALINAVFLLQQDIIFEGSGLVYAV